MKKLLETLYITTPESYLFERNGNICISIGGAEKAAVPITQVNSIVLFGKNTLSTALLSFCSQNDVTITFLSENGFFLGRLCGPVSGNVLLRKRQYETLADTAFANRFVEDLLFCKLRNSRSVLVRYARTASDEAEKSGVAAAAADLTAIANRLDDCTDIDSMRGIEGAAASVYFSRFDNLLSSPKGYRFETRSRRPPLNEVNAVLSFVYTLLAHDVRSSMEAVGAGPCRRVSAHPFARGGYPLRWTSWRSCVRPCATGWSFPCSTGIGFRRRILRQTLKRYTSARKDGERFLNSGGPESTSPFSTPFFEGESSHWDDPIRTVYAVCPCAARGSGSIPAVCVEVMTYDAGRNL